MNSAIFNRYEIMGYTTNSASRNNKAHNNAATMDAITAAVKEYNGLKTGTLLIESDYAQQRPQDNSSPAIGWLMARMDRFVKSGE